MKKQRIRILLVEDNLDDVSLLRRALKNLSAPIDLDVVDDGQQAVQFLQRTELYRNTLQPDLVLLDLNMPRKNGFEVLQEIKRDERLSAIPVIVMTTSSSGRDIVDAYRGGAACFVTKPDAFDQLKTFVADLFTFWRRVEFPSAPEKTRLS